MGQRRFQLRREDQRRRLRDYRFQRRHPRPAARKWGGRVARRRRRSRTGVCGIDSVRRHGVNGPTATSVDAAFSSAVRITRLSCFGWLLLLTLGVLASTASAAVGRFEQATLFRAGQGAYNNYRIPSVIRTTRNTLLTFCAG